MGKFCQFLTAICPQHVCIFISRDNFSKCQWIFVKLGICIDIVQIWFRIADGQSLSIFDSHLPAICLYFHFRMKEFSKYQWIFTKLGMCTDIVKICLGIANG